MHNLSRNWHKYHGKSLGMSLYNLLCNIHGTNLYNQKSRLCHNYPCSHLDIPNHIPFLPRFL